MDEAPLNGPRDRINETGGGEPGKQHVVKEDYVEVSQPVIASEIPEQIEPRDSYNRKATVSEPTGAGPDDIISSS